MEKFQKINAEKKDENSYLVIVDNSITYKIDLSLKEKSIEVRIKRPLFPIMYEGIFIFNELKLKYQFFSFYDLNGIFNLINKKIFCGSIQINETHYCLKLSLLFDIDGMKEKIVLDIPKLNDTDINSIVNELAGIVVDLGEKVKIYESILFPNYLEYSTIVRKEEIPLINSWINDKAEIIYKLLYKGTFDGDAAGDFHNKCDGKSHTLTIVETINGYRFGGFTTIAWDGSGSYKNDPDAFIYSLNKKRKFKGKGSNSIYCNSGYGPTFGDGHDFHICANYVGKPCYSNFQYSYGLKEDLEGCNKLSYLAGGYNFLIKELEVFQISIVETKK